jgi:hypothetical protein
MDNENIFNKIKVIDYLIYVKLIFANKNIYLENDHCYEIVSYLYPTINETYIINSLLENKSYKENMNINMFIAKYNIKEFFFKKHNSIYLNTLFKNKFYLNNYINVYIDFSIRKFETYNILYIKVDFYYTKYIINFLIDSFLFDIPLNISNKKYKDYNRFEQNMNTIWSKTSTICMSEFIYSSSIKKILFYQIYKKCFHKIIEKLSS